MKNSSDTPKSIVTYKFRIKDSSCRSLLIKKADAVNFVWNYCNQVSKQSADRRSNGGSGRWVSEFDLHKLMVGTSKELGLNDTTIQSVAGEFVARRNTRKTPKLKWRSRKKNLGWIPFKAGGVQVKGESVTYLKRKYRFWKSRDIEGKIKTGSFNQDAEGKWYINLNCEVEKKEATTSTKVIGIDLGLKTLATCSDGEEIENPKTLQKYSDKLATAQRASKKKQTTKLYAKIKNIRKDFLHKATTKLVKENKFSLAT